MVDDGPNLVTAEGLAQIDGHIARIEAAMALRRQTLAHNITTYPPTVPAW